MGIKNHTWYRYTLLAAIPLATLLLRGWTPPITLRFEQATKYDKETEPNEENHSQEAEPSKRNDLTNQEQAICPKVEQKKIENTRQNSIQVASAPEPPPVRNEKNHIWLKRLSLSHVEGDGQGIGFMNNYTTIDLLFGPDYQNGKVLPLLDLKGHRFDDNTYAANAGVIFRYLPKNFCAILGLNLFYDYREGYKGSFNQMGVGIEILSRRWDLRANAYVPFGAKKLMTTCVFDDYIGDFFAINKRSEFSSCGYNAEAGWLAVNSKNFLLYAAAGVYYLSGSFHQRTRGCEFRIRPQVRDYFALDLKVSYDELFRTVFQAQVFITIPLYQFKSSKSKYGPCCMTNRQVYQPVERFEVMPLGRRSSWKSNF
ncbi:MAG TPA: inverse autotransporter beta domain-containing protein [Rhabdochlamydiaceae bacterium]|nr:inverse autotransporter beta domain-containing protein [Rhabdochlamydiaceae bacterium]